MKLIANTNRLIASLIKDSTSRSILKSSKLSFLTVNFSEKEISKYMNDIISKAAITEEQFNKIKESILKSVETVNDSIIQNQMPEAKEIMDKIDPKDTPFIALALAVNNEGIWSDDRHFEKQNKIKVWKTEDLLDYIDK